MKWINRWKKHRAGMLAGVLTLALTAPAVVPGGVALAVDDGCLGMTGTGTLSATEIVQNDELILRYTLNPSGTHTVTTHRDPVDVIFVADYSGSMANHINSSSSSPIRMDMLKTSSQTLTNKLTTAAAQDRLGLIKFSTNASLEKSFTTNYASVQTAINALQPYSYTNIDEALTLAKSTMASSGVNQTKYVILLTDGAATRWTDDKGKVQSGDQQSADEAKKSADLIAPTGVKVYTIALAEPGSTEIDLNLLQYIATKTGAASYQASSTQQLSDIFDNIIHTLDAPAKLSNIVLHQPLPAGFILAPGRNAAGITFDSAKQEALIPVPDVAYPFQQTSIPLELHLIPTTAAGDYQLQDAQVAYKDACSASKQFTIPFGSTISVNVRAVDKYGNEYLGKTSGDVIRFRTGDKAKQWTIHEVNSSVTSIKFEENDTVVVVGYKNGSSRWDLKPTAPSDFTLKDASGTVIPDASWRKGPGKLTSISGSASQLPASTVYANDDFSAKFIAGYEFDIAGGEWRAYASGDTVTLPDGGNTALNARAFTNAISGSASLPVGGAQASRTVSLDSTPPLIGWKKTIDYPSDDATITIEATEDLSPLSSIKVWLDGSKNPSITVSAGQFTKNGSTYSYKFKLSDVYTNKDDRAGWHQIVYEATSVGGASKSAPDYFVVNPGPSADLVPDGYTQDMYADKPVTVNVKNLKLPVSDKTFGDVFKEGFTLKGMYYVINTTSGTPAASEWKKMAASRLTVTTKTDSTEGTYYVHLKLVDSENIETIIESMPISMDTTQNRN
ncbi:vWA domain-containing protein [Paenibacillus cremeus]|nr:vWA domain-containing protein [Paenibacillus cremeus]